MAGPTLENGRAGRRGFLHGWLDENWALCSHRRWSESIGRYFVHSAEATAAPTHALLTHGDCIIFIGGRNRGAEILRAPPAHRTGSALAETRFVQVEESAGPTISLPTAVMRSTALTILGTAGIPPHNILVDALQQVMAHAASGELRVETESVRLTDIENAWQRDPQGRRLVITP